MSPREKFVLHGRLEIIEHPFDRVITDPSELLEYCRTGRARLVHRDENLIVNQGLQAAAALLGGCVGSPTVGGSPVSDPTQLFVTTMQLGNTVSPAAPVATDTSGVGALVYSRAATVTYPTPGAVQYATLCTSSEFGSIIFTEEALLMANALVFAKFAPFSKQRSVGMGLQFNHVITAMRV